MIILNINLKEFQLKDNNITIADTDSAAIAYICKANDVECVVIKGISDFPINENESTNRTESIRTAFNSPFWPFVLASTSIGQEGLDFYYYCKRIRILYL